MYTHVPPALGQLTALTQLFCGVVAGDFVSPEATSANAAIFQAALPRLRWLACLALSPRGSGLQQLPGGLNALSRLTAPVTAVAASLPALSLWPRLQRLGLCSQHELEPAAAVQVLQWAAGRPALQLLELQMRMHGRPRHVVTALLELQRSRPEPKIEAKEDVFDGLYV